MRTIADAYVCHEELYWSIGPFVRDAAYTIIGYNDALTKRKPLCHADRST